MSYFQKTFFPDMTYISGQHLCKTDSSTLVGVAVGLSSVIIFSLVINGILTYKMLTGT